MVSIIVNGTERSVAADPDMPLLWALRDVLALKGTKYGCGVGLCGICTVLIDGVANHACMVPLGKVAGSNVTTIEGVAALPAGCALLDAWIAEQVPQCGYCQPGQIAAAAALVARTPRPSDREIDAALSGVLCRCGTFQRIRRAIRAVAADPPQQAACARAAVRGAAEHAVAPFLIHPELPTFLPSYRGSRASPPRDARPPRRYCDMRVQNGVLVPLGCGKHVRSDLVAAIVPIEQERGPGRRTFVYVEAWMIQSSPRGPKTR